MGVNSEEPNAGRINTSHDKVCTNVSLVSEEMLLEHSHACYDARLAAGGEGVEFKLGGYEGGGEFGISGCSSSSTPDLWRNVMKLFAVLEAKWLAHCGWPVLVIDVTLSATIGPLVALVSAAICLQVSAL